MKNLKLDYQSNFYNINFIDQFIQYRDFYYKKNLTNSILYLDILLNELKNIQNINIIPISKLMDDTGDKVISFRSDVDIGIWSIEKYAKLLNNLNIQCDFYILITAIYYSNYLRNNHFEINPYVLPMLKEIQNLNHNIGIHTDFFKFRKLDLGIEFFLSQLNYLRNSKILINSTSAHNSAYSESFENFFIFEEMDTNFLSKDIKNASISMLKNSLSFEANYPKVHKFLDKNKKSSYFSYKTDDPIRNKKWVENQFLYHPYFSSRYQLDIWLVGNDKWFIADREVNKVYYPINKFEILDYLKKKKKYKAVINIHTDYIY
jgi:hypothetical protein